MATLSAVASAAQSSVIPRYLHAGNVTVYSEYTITATLSAGDFITVAKVPDGARVIDVTVSFPTGLSDTGKLNVGTIDDHDLFLKSVSMNTTAVLGTQGYGNADGAGYQMSSSTSTKFTYIRAKVSDNASSGSGTTAGTLKFLITYANDIGATY